jgi:uncharacterized membrane protein
MQCPVCHSEVGPQNTFCTNCGSPIPGASAAPQQPAYEQVATPAYAGAPPVSSGPPGAAPVAGSGGLSESTAAAISYITIIPAIIFLVMDPYNKMPLVRFHSFQSIGLAVAWFAVWIAITILHVILHFIPLIGFLFVLIDLAVAVVFVIAWLIAIIKASKGEWFKLPVIGPFAEKMARG